MDLLKKREFHKEGTVEERRRGMRVRVISYNHSLRSLQNKMRMDILLRMIF